MRSRARERSSFLGHPDAITGPSRRISKTEGRIVGAMLWAQNLLLLFIIITLFRAAWRL